MVIGQNNYGHAPAPPFLVQTSDNGEAFYESSYGTLLSTSTAYKKLGYSAGAATVVVTSSSGSSPGAAHTNGASQRHEQQQQQTHFSQLYNASVELYPQLDLAFDGDQLTSGAVGSVHLTNMTNGSSNSNNSPTTTTTTANEVNEKTLALQESGSVVLESLAKSSLATHV